MGRMSRSGPPVTGFLTVVFAASLFGMLGPLWRYAYDAGMEPLPFVAWRAGIGLIGAAVFIAWRVSNGVEPLPRFGRLARAEQLTLLVAALLAFAIIGGAAILAAAVILQLGSAPRGRAVAAPAVEADQALPAGATVSSEGG